MTIDSSRFQDGSAIPSDVLEKVRQRDPEALGVLFDRHFSRIFNVAFRFVGERAAAEDITQEVFLRVYRAAHQLDPKRDPGPWLMTITSNLCREKWRSKEGRQAKQIMSLDAKPEVAEILPHKEPGPDMEILKANQNRLLNEAIGKLPEAMRLVVILHDFQGMSHEDIGMVVGDDAATVRKRYSRSLKKLRELLPEGLA